MLEGLWTATYASDVSAFNEGSISKGSGIFVFNNTIMGGDVYYYYKGTYEFTAENKFTGSIHITRYIENRGFTGNKGSVFGNLKEFDLKFVADINENVILGTGYVEQYKDAHFAARLVKRADLPEHLQLGEVAV